MKGMGSSWWQATLCALLVCTCAVSAAPLQLVSVRDPSQPPPVGGNGDSWGPILSPNGRFVLFSSTANNLVINSNGAFDEAKVRAAASQQSQTMTDLIVEKARIHSQLFQILTPEQKTKMTKLMDKHGRGMRHGQPQQQQQDQTPNQ